MAKISLPCLAAFVVSVLRVVPESCFARSISGDSKAGAFYYLVNFGYIEVWSLTQFYSVDFSKLRSSVKIRFQQTHNQGLRQLLLTVSWDLRA